MAAASVTVLVQVEIVVRDPAPAGVIDGPRAVTAKRVDQPLPARRCARPKAPAATRNHISESITIKLLGRSMVSHSASCGGHVHGSLSPVRTEWLARHGDNDLLAGPAPTLLPVEEDVVAELEDSADAEILVRRHPNLPGLVVVGGSRMGAGTRPGQLRLRPRGLSPGLDNLRRNGWRGQGPVPGESEGNQGFLRCLAGLARAAEAIGEDAEAERCRTFLADCGAWAADAQQLNVVVTVVVAPSTASRLPGPSAGPGPASGCLGRPWSWSSSVCSAVITLR